eukprot:857053-Rhodomonas_salina.3
MTFPGFPTTFAKLRSSTRVLGLWYCLRQYPFNGYPGCRVPGYAYPGTCTRVPGYPVFRGHTFGIKIKIGMGVLKRTG